MPLLHTMFNLGVNSMCNFDVHDLFTVAGVERNTPIARALELARARGMNQSGFAAAVGVTPQDITNWKKRGMPPEHFAKASEVVGCSMDELARGPKPEKPRLDAQPPKGGHWVERPQTGVTMAQVLSQVSPMIEPITIPWESILAESLPALFRAVIPDDAMGAEYPRGCTVNFSTTEGPPRARDLVLVADADGGVYFREYQTGRGGRWQAVAQSSGYQALDSEADGLRVLAISMGRWGRRG